MSRLEDTVEKALGYQARENGHVLREKQQDEPNVITLN